MTEKFKLGLDTDHSALSRACPTYLHKLSLGKKSIGSNYYESNVNTQAVLKIASETYMGLNLCPLNDKSLNETKIDYMNYPPSDGHSLYNRSMV